MVKLFDEIPYLENDRVVLKRLEDTDAGSLEEFVKSQDVYLYLPTYLIEQQHDAHTVIRMLYDDCMKAKDSLILGIFLLIVAVVLVIAILLVGIILITAIVLVVPIVLVRIVLIRFILIAIILIAAVLIIPIKVHANSKNNCK